MAKYLKRDCPDLNHVRVMVIGRDAPMNPDRYLYKHPERPSSFAAALYALLGVEDFEAFSKSFVLTDAMRCHVLSDHIPEKALTYCARHLREELKHFPNLRDRGDAGGGRLPAIAERHHGTAHGGDQAL